MTDLLLIDWTNRRRISLIFASFLVFFCQFLNAQAPQPFQVTGSGGYCQGSAGLIVGLSGSEAGVTYTLYRNGEILLPSIDGTGDIITFGAHTSGTYTISGTNIDGTTSMTGSAEIIENPLPSITFISQPLTNICVGAAVAYSTQASMTNYIWNFPGSANVDYKILSGGTTGSNNVTLEYLSTGSKTVSLNYTDSNGCTATISTSSNVSTVNPNPSTSAIHHQ
jgi:hypothetical protein